MFAARILTAAFVPTILFLAFADPAAAQLRTTQPPPKGSTTWFASVTFENKSDIAIVFTMEWDGRAAESVTLDAGRTLTTRTSFRAGQTEPKLTVKFESIVGGTSSSPVVQSLRAGMDVKNTNVGRIYDFSKKTSNVGEIIDLKPR
jgi:hypothetical protein